VRILIVGAGGHGQVVADILLAQRAAGDAVEVVGYVDDDAALHGQERLGIRVLGPITAIARIEHDAIVVAVGDNVRRAHLHDRLGNLPRRFAVARHPTAVVGCGASVGDGTMVCTRAVVGCASAVGRGVILNTACTIDHHAQIGDFVHVAPGVHLGGDVSVGAGSLIGIGAVVLPGVSIGSRAVVGAGAVVTRDVPDCATVVGVPASRIGSPVAGAR
jgi:sugar O-acyltransferase (sialic acid O-acetyltransferase NeuD family)